MNNSVSSRRPATAFLVLFLFAAFSLTSAHADLAADKNFLPPSFAKPVPPERALLLPDGKYLLLFDPDTLTDQAAGPITRYLADGTLDTTFSFSRDYKQVRAAVSAGNGKLYVAATRYLYGTKETEQILRLNSDGSIDPTFIPAVIASPDNLNFVWTMYLQPDGKILAAGYFATVSGIARGNIVRLMTDGTVDTTFNPPVIDGEVYAITVQPDNKILLGGVFFAVNSSNSLGVVRLNDNGSVDSTFNPSGFRRTPNVRIRGFAIQSGGKVVMAGEFRLGSSGSTPNGPLVRLNADGSYDSTFTFVTNITNPQSRDLAVQSSDGKLVVSVASSVYRFNSDGSRDSSLRQPVFLNAVLNPPTSAGTPVTVNLDANGRILVGGIFTDVDPPGAPNYAHFGVVRLNSDGTVDASLISSRRTGNQTAPSSFARLDNGSTLVSFRDKIDPAFPYNFGRLLPNGSRDSSFTLSSSDPSRFLTNFTAQGFEPLPDGKFFVYGLDTGNNRMAYGKIASNGVEDTTFTSNNGTFFQTATAAPDGKILLAAGNDPGITVYASLGRLQVNGQPDTLNIATSIHDNQVMRTQPPFGGIGTIQTIYAGSRFLAVQPDGKMLYEYLRSDGRFHFLRLDTAGSQEPGFTETTLEPTDLTQSFPVVVDPATFITVQPQNGAWTASFPLLDAHVQTDGRIVLVGQFKSFGGTAAHSIVRLEANGALDATFNPGAGPQWTSLTETATLFPKIENIEPLPDGKFLITGNFEAFDGTAAPGIAVLNANGSIDTSFNAPVQRDKRSRLDGNLKRQSDGSFLLSGPYKVFGESEARSLIRLVSLQPAAVNISTRLGVGTDENVLIEGFIVQGPAGSSKKIMVRAIGPSLSQFGIADALANPTLEIHDANSVTVARNNDWKTTQIGGLITGDQFAEINASGVAPTNDLESALIVSLEPGNYTAVVRGAGNTVGTGVVDAFDLDAGSAARVANIATRGLIQPGDKLMIGGFIVQNGSIKTVVRAIGPSLTAFGISNALPDTTLQLRDQQGAIVMENDDWKTSQQQELESTGLQPTHDLEAALVATIQPGQYTAQVRGKGDASGIGVVQVYFLQ